MGQIINRRIADSVLGTLADDASIAFDVIMNTLTHKAFLFEYRMWIYLQTLDFQEWAAEGGISICLHKQGLTAAQLGTILDGAQITDESAAVEIPTRQELFAIGHIKSMTAVSSAQGFMVTELEFQPSSKGGIPFVEGSGWSVSVINRTGGALTTGNLLHAEIYERFAYEGKGST